MNAVEFNFDSLVGPTHNYAGLSLGNEASRANAAARSQPRQAALQGLAKMKLLHDLGVPQGVMPPHDRPAIGVLRQLGFTGADHAILKRAAREAPRILAACASASSMWAANAATVSPSADTADGRVHFTPANLINRFHRSLEAPCTARILRRLFPDPDRFAHHDPLPAHDGFGDEGAANHNRLGGRYADPGIELFVYGRSDFEAGLTPGHYPARQSREACDALVRLHGLRPERIVIAQQNPAVIDAGVFHNDVISVANRDVFFYHQDAFANTPTVIDDLRQRLGDVALHTVEVIRDEVSVADAVRSYLFNSQLVDLPDQRTLLLAPAECEAIEPVQRLLETLPQRWPHIAAVRTIDLRQSMRNGGGPACLRLRVVLTDAEQRAMNPAVRFDDALHARLQAWIERHYRDRLEPADLGDPALLDESRTALDELSELLDLGAVYEFQQA